MSGPGGPDDGSITLPVRESGLGALGSGQAAPQVHRPHLRNTACPGHTLGPLPRDTTDTLSFSPGGGRSRGAWASVGTWGSGGSGGLGGAVTTAVSKPGRVTVLPQLRTWALGHMYVPQASV